MPKQFSHPKPIINMKGLGVFLALTFAGACVATLPDGLKVTFSAGMHPEKGENFFFDMPRTISAAIESGWESVESADPHHPTLELMCPGTCGPDVCLYYDPGTGHVAGLRICISEEDFSGKVFDWKIQGYTPWIQTSEEGKEIKYQCTAHYYVSKEFLKKSVEERRASRTTEQILQENMIWTIGINGQLDAWSTDQKTLEQSIWTPQACIPWMGKHLYYNMTSTTECKAGLLYGWFPLCDNGKIVGIGHIAFGKLPNKEGCRNWFEAPPKLAVQAIVPRGPECLYELAENPGLVTLHTYFTSQPWSIGCSIGDILHNFG